MTLLGNSKADSLAEIVTANKTILDATVSYAKKYNKQWSEITELDIQIAQKEAATKANGKTKKKGSENNFKKMKQEEAKKINEEKDGVKHATP